MRDVAHPCQLAPSLAEVAHPSSHSSVAGESSLTLEGAERAARVAMPRRVANVFRRLRHYVKHDLREIVWPRPMPDPPGTRYLTDLTLRQHLQVLRQAAREYIDGWRWYNGEPEKERKERLAAERAARGEAARDDYEEPEDEYRPDPEDTTTFRDELGRMYGAGAKVGVDGWRRQLRSFYETRGVAYMNAMKEFVAGYKEGIEKAAEPMQLEEDEEVGAAESAEPSPPPDGAAPPRQPLRERGAE